MLGPEEVTTELVNSKEVMLTERHGLIPRAIVHLFQALRAEGRSDVTATVKCSYTEIYNESINDLLSDPPAKNLRIREFPRLGMCIIGVTERYVTNPGEVGECLANGTVNRITCATEMNQRSSRSHTIFTLTVEQLYSNGSSKIAKLNLVDLAGSEKIAKTGASGQALIEAQNINLSLTTLGRCIKALASSKDEHVPYRESKLTMILKEALGGNAKTALICTASMRNFHCEESLSTLKFAERAKKIQVKARSNVQLSQSELLALVEKLKAEVKQLRGQLQNRDEAGTPAPRDDSQRSYTPEFTAGHLMEHGIAISGHYQDHLEHIEEANHMVSELFAEKQQIKARYESEICTIRKQLDAAIHEAEACRREVDDAKSMTERFRFEVGLKDSSLRHTTSQLRSVETELRTAIGTIEETRAAVSSLSRENERLHTENLSLQSAAEEAQLRADKLQPSLLQMQQQLTLITKRRERHSKTIAPTPTSESSLTAIKAMVDDLKERLATRDSQLQEAQENSKRLAQEFSYKEAELQVRLTLAQAEIKSLTKAVCEFAQTDDDHIELAKPAINLKPVIAKLMQEMTTLQREYQTMVERFRVELARTKEAAEERASDLEKRLLETSEQLSREKAAGVDLRKGLKLAEIEQDSLQFRLKMARTEIATVTAQFSQEKAQSQRLLAESEALRTELQAMQRESIRLRTSAEEEVTASRKSWQDIEQSLKAQIDSLQVDLMHTKSESLCLADMLRTKEAELKFSSSVIFDLEAKLEFLAQKDQRLDSAIMYFRRRQESMALPRGDYGSRSSSFCESEANEVEKPRNVSKDLSVSDIRALYTNESEDEAQDAPAMKSYIHALEEPVQIVDDLPE